MNFDVTIVLKDTRHDPELGETLLERCLEVLPDCDPVVAQDAVAHQATVRLTVSADDAAAASLTTVAILDDVPGAHQIVPTAIHVDAAGDRELQAA